MSWPVFRLVQDSLLSPFFLLLDASHICSKTRDMPKLLSLTLFTVPKLVLFLSHCFAFSDFGFSDFRILSDLWRMDNFCFA